MVTGSIASSIHGEPRLTHDVDIVIQLFAGEANRLSRLFSETRYYLDEEAIELALQTESMCNLIDVETSDKVDFYILKSEPFDQMRFARRRTASPKIPFDVSTPEDTILMKLKWARAAGGSEKQLRDALRIYEVQGTALDVEHLRRWAERLSVEDLLDRIIAPPTL